MKIKNIVEFIPRTSVSGILLMLCVTFSLFMANSAWSSEYLRLLEYEAGISIGGFGLHKSLTHWINDLLMSIFFLLVGLEVKREIVKGELSSMKRAILPIAAAIGGIVMPVTIYLLYNYGNEHTLSGWAVPMATDIAFALSVLSLAPNVPRQVRVFLTSLAIADDIAAILVIALFYGEGISFFYLGLAFAVMLFLLLLNRMKVQSLAAYLLPGIFLWYFVYRSGIHATIAGVMLAMTIPVARSRKHSPLETLEQRLHAPVSFFIIPLFALANTAIALNFDPAELYANPASMGIILGLVVGKVTGIALATFAAIKLGAAFPSSFRWSYITGIGFLGGIGFTMSIFISLLAFDDRQTQELAKVSILIASFISGAAGFILLRKKLSRTKPLSATLAPEVRKALNIRHGKSDSAEQ